MTEINKTRKASQRKQWHPTPVLLPGKSHGRRSLVGCSPWGRKESDTTEQLHFHFSLSCTGEGNGNPLQCSCLDNPRDRGAWWAAIYGVTKSWTWLKWLNSSKKGPDLEAVGGWRDIIFEFSLGHTKFQQTEICKWRCQVGMELRRDTKFHYV